MCHNFFTHSSVDGYLHCFHILAIVNSAAMNNFFKNLSSFKNEILFLKIWKQCKRASIEHTYSSPHQVLLSREGFRVSPYRLIACVCVCVCVCMSIYIPTYCCSVAKLCLTLCNPMEQSARLSCPSPSPGVCSHSCPLSR